MLALVAHIEGADALDEEGEQLQAFYDAGVRSIGPFWNLPNRFGVGVTGAFPGSPDSGPGLTDAGKALIKQANALNMLIDVSHMNEKAFWDTAALSRSPLVATHSNAHALCAQPRNLTDRHTDRPLKIMGSDRVALRSDSDGNSVPEPQKDVAGLPRLFAAFRDAGYDQDRLEKLASDNWLRVLRQVWQG